MKKKITKTSEQAKREVNAKYQKFRECKSYWKSFRQSRITFISNHI